MPPLDLKVYLSLTQRKLCQRLIYKSLGVFETHDDAIIANMGSPCGGSAIAPH
jgi:hypothetical protein